MIAIKDENWSTQKANDVTVMSTAVTIYHHRILTACISDYRKSFIILTITVKLHPCTYLLNTHC